MVTLDTLNQEKLALYFSIDWLNISKFLLEDCGYDGWGWEFLFFAVKNQREGAALAHLFRKFNLNFRVPDPTVFIENINPAYDAFAVLHNLVDEQEHSLLVVKEFVVDEVLFDFFESIDIVSLAQHFPIGIRTKRSHNILAKRIVTSGDRDRILLEMNKLSSR